MTIGTVGLFGIPITSDRTRSIAQVVELRVVKTTFTTGKPLHNAAPIPRETVSQHALVPPIVLPIVTIHWVMRNLLDIWVPVEAKDEPASRVYLCFQ